MRLIRGLALVAVLAIPIPLSGCLTSVVAVDNAIGNTTDSAKFRQTCQAIEAANLVYLSFSNYPGIAEKISAKTRNAVETAYTIANRTCNNPPKDIAGALTTILDAYNTILNAQKSANVTLKNTI